MRFLRQSIGVDSAQLATAERGEAVVKVLETQGRRDIAIFGIVTIDVTRDAYTRQVRDFENSLRTPTRSRFGIFGDPASASDVEAVTISPRDVADMKDCRPGDCVVKLPATDMQRIREGMDWSAPDLQAQLSAYARRRLVEYVTDYRARGDSAMAIYDDRGTLNVRARDAFAGLLAESPYVYYANHYFEAAVELTCVVERQRSDGTSGSYVLALRRYRFDNLPSGGLLNIRGRAIGALRDQMLADLRRQKATAERAAGR